MSTLRPWPKIKRDALLMHRFYHDAEGMSPQEENAAQDATSRLIDDIPAMIARIEELEWLLTK